MPTVKTPTDDAEKPDEPAATETGDSSAAPVTAAELNGRVSMPVVDESAIAAASQPSTSPPGPSVNFTMPEDKPERDSINRAFNPEKFVHEKDSLGRWKTKGGGRKPGGKNASKIDSKLGSIDGESSSSATAQTGAGGDKYDQAAEVYCRAFYSVMDGVFSANGEWQPENQGEHDTLRGSLSAYLRVKQMEDLPPGWALAFAAFTYSAKRATKPNTLTKLRVYVYWIKSKWATWIMGRKAEEISPAVIAPTELRHLPPQPDARQKAA